MSSEFNLSRQKNAVLAAHPWQEGWMNYECDEGLSGRLYLHYLLDFLRDAHPGALKKRLALKEVVSDDVIATINESHIVEPGSEWDRKELDSDGWTGSVEIEWEKQPIHYYSWNTLETGGEISIVIIATQSNAALRDFHKSLSAYGHARETPTQPKIIVVNGSNISIPKVSWDDVILPPGMAQKILNNARMFFRAREQYQKFDIPYRRGFLFAGPPGNGKTLTLKAIANAMCTEATIITVLVRSNVNEHDIHRAFHLAERHSPALIIFEDLDKLVESEYVSLSHFLNILDGLKVLDGVLVIATTNEPGRLDPALLHRPSRFDRVWTFPLPDVDQRLSLLQKKGRRYFSQPVLEEVAKRSKGFTMAYVQEIIVNALLTCAHMGKDPDDASLLESFKTLKAQRKAASKEDEAIADRESLGFQPDAGRRKLYPFLYEHGDNDLEEAG